MKTKKLLIIDWNPYGSLTDSYKWCEYLRTYYNITLLAPKNNASFPVQEGIKYYSINANSQTILGRTWTRLSFVIKAFWLTLWFKGKIFVVYYPSSYWLKRLLPWKKLHLDIRTLSVNKDKKKRTNYNNQLIKACHIFDSVSVISEGIKTKINRKDIVILPLGADIISLIPKKYDDEIRILYIGTLKSRDIPKTIEGLFLFRKLNPKVKVKYDIIGSGSDSDNQEVVECINRFNLNDIITYHGFLNHSQSKIYFDSANIGCAFVPITEYFEYQPPTKVFEYSMSGLYTIATKTTANSMYISQDNGELITDTAQDFCNALNNYLTHCQQLDETKIRNSLKKYSWKNIVENTLQPILKKI